MSIEQAINDLPDDVPSQKLDLYGISAADLKRLVRKLAAAREALEHYADKHFGALEAKAIQVAKR